MGLTLPSAPIFERYERDRDMDLFIAQLTWYDSLDELTSALRETDMASQPQWRLSCISRRELLAKCGEDGTVNATRVRTLLDRAQKRSNGELIEGNRVRAARVNYALTLEAIRDPREFSARFRVLLADSFEATMENVYGPLKSRGGLTPALEEDMNKFTTEYTSTISRNDVDVNTFVQLAVRLRFLIRRMGATPKPSAFRRIVDKITKRGGGIAHDAHANNLLEPNISQRKMQLYRI